ncbi:MAG: NHL repeat-containing protein [Anaerolineae bacterium]
MNLTLRVLLLLILLLSVLPQGQAAAQPAVPERPEAAPPAPDGSGELNALRRAAMAAGSGAAAAPSAVSLGQPGLSYRYVATLGQTERPYQIDTQHLNRPIGLTVDSFGFVYVVEERGFRMLKYNAAGQSQMTAGKPGQPWYHADYLAFPQDVAVAADGALWVVIQHGVKQLTRQGALVQTFPASSPWTPGVSNSRFRYPRGVALDTANRLYISDSGNQRIQVYSIASGAPVYHSTIGETGVAGGDNGHFSFPAHLALDGANRLYVADRDNARVQRCTLTSGWSCSTFHGTGSAGAGADQLASPEGVAVDGAGNVWIADSGNGRVKKCSAAGSCALFAGGLGNPTDVAVADGVVYVADWTTAVVQRYGTDGAGLGVLAGVAGVPYVTTGTLFNAPAGAGLAADGSLYVLENWGYRLLKQDAAGQPLWSVGQAGVPGSGNQRLGALYQGPQGSMALDASGRVYIPDTGNHRVQVFNADGSFSRSFGSLGAGNSQFNCPSGVAISPLTRDILVVDTCNERVQLFDSAWNYRQTLGVTGAPGASDRHFNSPAGVAVDAAGAVYVADTDNYRVQKCVLAAGAYACTTFAGETGLFSSSFNHLHPVSVAVDSAGRVAVVDQRNSRVQVFDRLGNYLTTIGGLWGPESGNLRLPTAVQADQAGNLVVADQDNQRVQRYAPGTPGWTQWNLNGFGDPGNGLMLSLANFNGVLYAGTDNPNTGAQLWRNTADTAGQWSALTSNGFGDSNNGGIDHLLAFDGQLYAGTWNWNAATNSSLGGQVWRSANGVDWTRVVNNGFGDVNNGEIVRFAVFGGQIYAGTWSYSDTRGGELWRSASGSAGSWSRVVVNGFEDSKNEAIISMAVFNSQLYAGTLNTVTGGQIWRSADGAAWNLVNTAGFGLSSNWVISALAAFDGYLYASTRDGGQVWRCQVCDGSDWQRVVNAGFGNPATVRASALETAGGALFWVVGNYDTGLEVWRTVDGVDWQQVGFAGLGDSNNRAPFWDNSALGWGNKLLVGTWNSANGGEIWAYQPTSVYLPVGLR